LKEIVKNVYYLGNAGCEVYLINSNSSDGLILIDCGMDLNLITKIEKSGLDPQEIKHCIITHFHIDHIGACHDLEEFNEKVKFYAHELDSKPIEEEGHDRQTAASWYGVSYKPIKLFRKFKKDIEILSFGNYNLQCIHTPGHTPGSISILLDAEGKKILFGQDIHGPFMREFGSDLKQYQKSMQKLLDLEPDILCEGHFGIIQPADHVKNYILDYMRENKP